MSGNATALLKRPKHATTQQRERSTYENATSLPALNDATGLNLVACLATTFSPRKTVVCCVVASFRAAAAAYGDHVWSINDLIGLLD
jgi:hypothetical protein